MTPAIRAVQATVVAFALVGAWYAAAVVTRPSAAAAFAVAASDAARSDPARLCALARDYRVSDVVAETFKPVNAAIVARNQTAYVRALAEAQAAVTCSLAQSPLDGFGYAALAWLEWRATRDGGRAAQFLQRSYEVARVEPESLPLRLVVAAGLWHRLPPEIHTIADADLDQLFASNYAYDVTPLLAQVFAEAGQANPPYAAARTRIAGLGAAYLEKFDMLVRPAK